LRLMAQNGDEAVCGGAGKRCYGKYVYRVLFSKINKGKFACHR